MFAKDIVKYFAQHGVYIPMVSYQFFVGLQTCAKVEKLAAIKILRGLNTVQDLRLEKEAVEWLVTINVEF
jgi:hypothetical protein